jgi:hypothetical protein
VDRSRLFDQCIYQVLRVAAQAESAAARVDEQLPDVDWEALHALFGDLVMTTTGIFSPESHLRDEQRTLAWYFDALERRDHFIAVWEKYFQGGPPTNPVADVLEGRIGRCASCS